MKKKGLILPFFIVFVISIHFAHAKNLEIVCEEEWKPYIYFENGKPKGYSFEILEYVLKNMEIEYTLTPYPWKRALKYVMKGRVDALFNASKKTDREEACHYPSEDLLKSKYVFFILKRNEKKLKYQNFEDLKGHLIGVALGYSYTPEFWNFVKINKNYLEARNDKLNFKKLSKGRIDYFPAEIGNGKAIIEELGIGDIITYLPKPLTQKPYYIIFNKSRIEKEFVDMFSNTLEEFKKSPEYKGLYDKYF